MSVSYVSATAPRNGFGIWTSTSSVPGSVWFILCSSAPLDLLLQSLLRAQQAKLAVAGSDQDVGGAVAIHVRDHWGAHARGELQLPEDARMIAGIADGVQLPVAGAEKKLWT